MRSHVCGLRVAWGTAQDGKARTGRVDYRSPIQYTRTADIQSERRSMREETAVQVSLC